MAALALRETQKPIDIVNQSSPGIANGKVLPKAKGIDVKYESGVSTIRISGTPVLQRKQAFEQPKRQNTHQLREGDLTGSIKLPNGTIKTKSDPGNDVKKSSESISASIEILPDFDNGESNCDEEVFIKDINDNETKPQARSSNNTDVPKQKSGKKVSFHETVSVDKDKSTSLNGQDDIKQVKQENIGSVSSPAISEVVQLTPIQKEKVDMLLTESIETHEPSAPKENGYATPIVDEYELRQLSRKLSSRERAEQPQNHVLTQQKPVKVKPEAKDKVQYLNDRKINTTQNKQSSLKRNEKTSKDYGKYKKKLETNRVCKWLAVVAVVLVVAGLIVVGILYAISVSRQSTDEIKALLISRLSLSENNSPFAGQMSRTDDSIAQILLDSGDHMTWQSPQASVKVAWHRGATIQIQALPKAGGTPSSFRLGDIVDEEEVRYNALLTDDHWYAARIQGTDDYCLLSLFYTGNTTWVKANQETLLALYADYESIIINYS